MHIYAKLILAFLVVVFSSLLGSCAATKAETDEQFSNCSVNQECKLHGKLKITETSHGSIGILNNTDDCVSLALPEEVVKEKRKWEGKKVVVTGRAHSNSYASGVISYTLVDRNVLVGYCHSEIIIYVADIQLK